MRKKLFAVIMSAMMMITFMPSMAFAADTVVWGDKCASLSVNGASYTVKRVWDPATGSITASVDTSAYGPGITLPTDTRTFYDLDSAVIEPTYSTMNTTQFTDLFGNPATAPAKTAVTVKLTAPNYCSNYDGLSAGAKVKAGVNLAGVATLTVDTPAYDVEKQFENQTFTIKATATPVLDATAVVYGGANLTKTFTVQPILPANASAVAILIDGKTALTSASAPIDLEGYVDYDAAEHTVAIQKAPGFTAAYQVWNAEKGLWEDVDVIKATNVGTVDAKVTVKNSNNTADVVTKRIQFDIDPVDVEFRFDEKGLTASDTYYFEVSDDYKTVDYVKAYPDNLWGSSATAPEHFAYDKACKAAVKANQALLMEYFNDFYEIETQDGMFPVASTSTKATMAVIKAKDLTALTVAEKDALVAKYGTLLKNFDVSNVTRNNITTTSYMLSAGTGDYAYFVVVPNTKTNDVDFIGSATKKVHIKNAAKIKKAKTVTIKADALGVAPKFKKLSGNSKIKVAASGKVTLKKGLKKGTYKVKVKAYSPEGKGYKYAKATRTYTIKVVK